MQRCVCMTIWTTHIKFRVLKIHIIWSASPPHPEGHCSGVPCHRNSTFLSFHCLIVQGCQGVMCCCPVSAISPCILLIPLQNLLGIHCSIAHSVQCLCILRHWYVQLDIASCAREALGHFWHDRHTSPFYQDNNRAVICSQRHTVCSSPSSHQKLISELTFVDMGGS